MSATNQLNSYIATFGKAPAVPCEIDSSPSVSENDNESVAPHIDPALPSFRSYVACFSFASGKKPAPHSLQVQEPIPVSVGLSVCRPAAARQELIQRVIPNYSISDYLPRKYTSPAYYQSRPQLPSQPAFVPCSNYRPTIYVPPLPQPVVLPTPGPDISGTLNRTLECLEDLKSRISAIEHGESRVCRETRAEPVRESQADYGPETSRLLEGTESEAEDDPPACEVQRKVPKRCRTTEKRRYPRRRPEPAHFNVTTMPPDPGEDEDDTSSDARDEGEGRPNRKGRGLNKTVVTQGVQASPPKEFSNVSIQTSMQNFPRCHRKGSSNKPCALDHLESVARDPMMNISEMSGGFDQAFKEMTFERQQFNDLREEEAVGEQFNLPGTSQFHGNEINIESGSPNKDWPEDASQRQPQKESRNVGGEPKGSVETDISNKNLLTERLSTENPAAAAQARTKRQSQSTFRSASRHQNDSSKADPPTGLSSDEWERGSTAKKEETPTQEPLNERRRLSAQPPLVAGSGQNTSHAGAPPSFRLPGSENGSLLSFHFAPPQGSLFGHMQNPRSITSSNRFNCRNSTTDTAAFNTSFQTNHGGVPSPPIVLSNPISRRESSRNAGAAAGSERYSMQALDTQPPLVVAEEPTKNEPAGIPRQDLLHQRQFSAIQEESSENSKVSCHHKIDSHGSQDTQGFMGTFSNRNNLLKGLAPSSCHTPSLSSTIKISTRTEQVASQLSSSSLYSLSAIKIQRMFRHHLRSRTQPRPPSVVSTSSNNTNTNIVAKPFLCDKTAMALNRTRNGDASDAKTDTAAILEGLCKSANFSIRGYSTSTLQFKLTPVNTASIAGSKKSVLENTESPTKLTYSLASNGTSDCGAMIMVAGGMGSVVAARTGAPCAKSEILPKGALAGGN